MEKWLSATNLGATKMPKGMNHDIGGNMIQAQPQIPLTLDWNMGLVAPSQVDDSICHTTPAKLCFPGPGRRSHSLAT